MSETHDQLLENVITIQDLQCAWFLFLLWCSGELHPQSRPPRIVREFRSTPRCIVPQMPQPTSRGCSCQHLLDLASLVLTLPAFWSSWADCLEMAQQRRPTVCSRIVDTLYAQHPSFHLAGVCTSAELSGRCFSSHPHGGNLAAGVRPQQLRWDVDVERGLPRGCNAQPQNQSMAFSSFPTSRLSRMDLPSSVCCFFGVFGFPSDPPRASAGVAVHLTALRCVNPARGKSELIKSSLGHTQEPDLLFSPVKCEEDCPSWRSLVRNLPPSTPAETWHGSGGILVCGQRKYFRTVSLGRLGRPRVRWSNLDD